MLRIAVIGLATLTLFVVLAAYGPGSLNAARFKPTPPDPALDAFFTDPAQPPRSDRSFRPGGSGSRT